MPRPLKRRNEVPVYDPTAKLSKLGAGLLLIIAAALLLLWFGPIYTIDSGERGVELTFGKADEISVAPGIHLRIPFVQKVVKFETRTKKLEATSDSSSKDLQDVQTTIALNYHIIPEEVPKLYSELGVSYESRVVSPAIEEAVKSVSARYTAEELITKRPKVREDIKNALKEKLRPFYIQLDEFNIVNFQFSEEFDKAIEAKVTAEQLKLKAERDLQRIIIEKDQRIAQAQAEAEALRLQKQEITPDLIRLREIEAQIKAIEKWDGNLPTFTGGAIPFIDLNSLQE